MRRALLLLAALAAADATRYYHESEGIAAAERIRAAEDAARIVGGSPAALGAYPYLGGLVIALTNGANSVCGCTLLSNSRAVTAAHCWFDGRQQARHFTVVLGSARLFSGGTRVTTASVQMHARWNPHTHDNDIAIIGLPRINFSNVIRPAVLPSGSLLRNNFAGWTAAVAGFGRTRDGAAIGNDQIQSHVHVQVITNDACLGTFGNSIIDSTLCTSGAGGRGPCGGDSGGPLVVTSGNQRVLVGVVSFGHSRGCQAGFPSAYARVTSFNSWIRSRI